MRCDTCGNDLHIAAEACWRCGSLTARGHERELELQEEARRQVEIQAIDYALHAEYERHTYKTEDGSIRNTLGDPDNWLSWESDGGAHSPTISPPSRRTRLIRKIREFVGEEPEPAIVPRAAKILFGWLIVASILFVGAIWIALAMVEFLNNPLTAKYWTPEWVDQQRERVWLLLLGVLAVLIFMVNKLYAARKFGKLKRELRQYRKEATDRHAVERNSS